MPARPLNVGPLKNFSFTITRNGDTSGGSTVHFGTSSGTASSASDYNGSSGTVTFNPGDTTKTVTIHVKGDTTVEANETFKVNLSAATGATISDSQGIGTIINDDPTKSKISIAGVSLTEGNSGTKAFQFKVVLDKASSTPVTVKYATSNGTATAGSDYTALLLSTLTFAANETTKFITVQVKGDTLHEADETFFLNLSSATNAIIAVSKGTGTIRNDD